MSVIQNESMLIYEKKYWTWNEKKFHSTVWIKIGIRYLETCWTCVTEKFENSLNNYVN